MTRMLPLMAGATRTGATGSGSGASFLPQDTSVTPRTVQHAKRMHVRITGALERPCKSLKRRERDAVSHHAVVVGVSRLFQRRLRVHDFENRHFAGLIAQECQA